MSDPVIEFGNREGRYFTQWRWNDLLSLARELHEVVPQATGWKLWYDAHHDFHRLEFDAEGHHYAVRYYKVYAISRDGDENYGGDAGSKNFGRSTWELVMMFKSGRFRNWEDKKLLW